MPAHAKTLMTAEELLHVDIPDKWTELVGGHLVVREPPAPPHGRVSARLAYVVGTHVYPNRAGELFGQDTGFRIASNPDTVRAPDLAFLSTERAAAMVDRHGYWAIVPDLVAEVVSPSDRPGEVLSRAGMWLAAGVRLVWVVDPVRRTAHVHRPDGSVTVLGAGDTLDGEAVLPGFTCPLADVLG
jgi:Uma2 family endonuclease